MNKRELLNILQRQTQFNEDGYTYFTFTHLSPIVEFINVEEQLISEQELASIAIENGYGILNVFPEETYPTGLVAYPIDMKDPETQLLLWYADMYGMVPTFESYTPDEELKEDFSKDGGGFSYKDIGDFDTYEGILIQGLEEVAGSSNYSKYDDPQNCIITPRGVFVEASYENRDYFNYVKAALNEFKFDFEDLAQRLGHEQEIKDMYEYEIEYLSVHIEEVVEDICIIIDTLNRYEYRLTFPLSTNLTDEQIDKLPQVVDALKDKIQGELVIMSVPITKVIDVDLSKGSEELVAIAKHYKETGVLESVKINEGFEVSNISLGEDALIDYVESIAVPIDSIEIKDRDRVYVTPKGKMFKEADIIKPERVNDKGLINSVSYPNVDLYYSGEKKSLNLFSIYQIMENKMIYLNKYDKNTIYILFPPSSEITKEQIEAITQSNKLKNIFDTSILKCTINYKESKDNFRVKPFQVLLPPDGNFDDFIHTLKEYKNNTLTEDFNIVDYPTEEDAFLEFIETVSIPELNRTIYYEPVYITPQGNFIMYYLNSNNHKMLITSGGGGEITISSEEDVNFDITDGKHLFQVFMENCIAMERVNEGLAIYLPKPQNLTDKQISAFINSGGVMNTFNAVWESYERARGLYTHNGGWVNIIAEPKENTFQSFTIKQSDVEEWREVLEQLEELMKDYRKTGSIENQEPLEEAKEDTDRFKEWAGDPLYNMFVQFKNRLKGQERDIYYWMSKKYGQHELYGKLSELKDKQTRKQYREKAKEGAETIYKDTTWEVLKITSVEASCLYGKNTMWCISGEAAEDYFDTNGVGYYYFFINKKTRKKYAISYTSENDYIIYSEVDTAIPYIKDAPRVEGLPNLSKPPQELVDSIRGLNIKAENIYGYEEIVEMGVLSDEELFDIPHEMGSPLGSVVMVDSGNSYCFIFLDGDYDNISDITDTVNQIILDRGDFEESLEGKPSKKELKKMADKHKKANKRKGRGWWENPNAGNVKHNIDIFNHMMGANTGPHPLSQGYAETSGEGMGESLREEFELTEKIEKHDVLNPKLWEGMELKPEVKERALLVVDDFVEELKEDGVTLPIKDIIIIGSNASYNYSETSDLDLHIIYDEKELECPTEVYPLLYSAYRSIYNKKHPIDFYGVGVEIYVEDGSTGMQLTKLNGVYSLNKGWIKEPSIDFVPDVESLDLDRINSEFNKWEDKYFAIINEREDIDVPVEEDLTTVEEKQLEDIINFIEDIYILRRSSIKTEGEYGVGNLVFKEIRSMGYLDTLKELKSELKAKALSLE